MKHRLIVMAAVAVAVFVGSMVYFASSNQQTGHVDAMRILAATRTYAADLKARGLTVPATVTVQELIHHHLLRASDVSGLAGMDVTFNLSAADGCPQSILVRACLANGDEVALLADGSVQQMPPNRARETGGTNPSPASH